MGANRCGERFLTHYKNTTFFGRRDEIRYFLSRNLTGEDFVYPPAGECEFARILRFPGFFFGVLELERAKTQKAAPSPCPLPAGEGKIRMRE